MLPSILLSALSVLATASAFRIDNDSTEISLQQLQHSPELAGRAAEEALDVDKLSRRTPAEESYTREDGNYWNFQDVLATRYIDLASDYAESSYISPSLHVKRAPKSSGSRKSKNTPVASRKAGSSKKDTKAASKAQASYSNNKGKTSGSNSENKSKASGGDRTKPSNMNTSSKSKQSKSSKSSKPQTQRNWQKDKADAKAKKQAMKLPTGKEKTRPETKRKTKADKQDASKPSTGKGSSPNTGTAHFYSKKTDHHFNANKSAFQVKKDRADVERVVGESLRHPNNDQTHGAGAGAANSVIRSDIHPTESTKDRPGLDKGNNIKKTGKEGDQQVITSVQRAPGNAESTVRHLPVIYDKKGNAHYDPRQQEAQFPNKRNRKSEAAPPRPQDTGRQFYPRKRSVLVGEYREYAERRLRVRSALHKRSVWRQIYAQQLSAP